MPAPPVPGPPAPAADRPGVLFVGHALDAPPHKWMRSMFRGLGDRVAALAAPQPAPAWVPGGVRYVRLDGPRTGPRGGPGDPARAALKDAVADPRVGPTLFHFLNRAVPYLDLWDGAGKPVFVHVHGYDVTWDMRRHDAGTPPAHPADYLDRVRAAPASTRFIAAGAEVRGRLLAAGVAADRVHLKPPGVKLCERPAPRPAGGPVRLLYLGRLVDCKGPEVTVRAFADAAAAGLDGVLTVAGDGPLAAAAQLAAADSGAAGRVRFLGEVSPARARELLAAADIFTAHSRTGPLTNQVEAFGVAFAEALAAGVPVVTGRSGGVPEVMPAAGEPPAGALFEPGDVAAHAAALLKLGSDAALRRELSLNAWRHAKTHLGRGRENRRLRALLGVGGDAAAPAPDHPPEHAPPPAPPAAPLPLRRAA